MPNWLVLMPKYSLVSCVELTKCSVESSFIDIVPPGGMGTEDFPSITCNNLWMPLLRAIFVTVVSDDPMGQTKIFFLHIYQILDTFLLLYATTSTKKQLFKVANKSSILSMLIRNWWESYFNFFLNLNHRKSRHCS